MTLTLRHVAVICVALSALSACTTTRFANNGKSKEVYKVGNPYQVQGQWYAPKEEPDYDEVGMASWYGPGFHGKSTANGDEFDQHALTAAHRTLPLPSLVRVTNMENGRTAVLKVNDRGPFSKDRIIDVSGYAAEILGFKNQGVQKVRVQFLPRETEDMLADLGLKKPGAMSATAVANVQEPVVSDRLTENMASIATPEVERHELGAAAPAEPRRVAYNNYLAPEMEEPVVVSKPAPAPASAKKEKFSIIPEAYAEDDKHNNAPAMNKATSTESLAAMAPSSGGKLSKASQAVAKAEGTQASVKDKVFIQIGSFGVKENADKATQKLASVGKVASDEVTVNNKTLYRVRMGPFNNAKDAETALESVHNDGFKDARIVHN